MNSLDYIIHFIVYEFIVIILMSLVLLPFIGLVELFEHLNFENGVDVARIIATPLIIALLLLPTFIAFKAAHHRVERGLGFYGAYQVAWLEAKAELSFLPIIGRWFVSRSLEDRNDKRH